MSGFYWQAHYRLFRGPEPSDSELRDTALWRKWADRQTPEKLDAVQRGESPA